MSILSTHVRLLILALLVGLISACGSSGGGGSVDDTGGTVDDTGGDQPGVGLATVIRGKVVLSRYLSAVQNAKLTTPSQKIAGFSALPKGQAGSRSYQKSMQILSQKPSPNGLRFFSSDTVVSNATVWLYDSNHPEWIYPVAASETDANGDYSLSVLINSAENLAADGSPAYTDGADIPGGNYTLLAFTPGGFDPLSGTTTAPIVAVQTIVTAFDGTVAGNDLVAQNSSATPTVETMFGQARNTDGTQTWGQDGLGIPATAAIQVTFSMAMSRGSIATGIDISPAMAGEWAISADWLSATFYPEAGALTQGQTYTVTVNGDDGATTTVKNVYGNALQMTATGTFTVLSGAEATDSAAPSAIVLSPTVNTGVDVITPIRIASNEILDVNNILLTSAPTLGAQPGILYVGENSNTGTQFRYIYEFILAQPLALGSTYDITVAGGTDMSGNVMNDLNYSFATSDAADLAGVDETAAPATQDIQAEVRDVFGRWVRSFNERSLTQLRSLMLGDFVFEYNAQANGSDENDLNRDGRYDLAEFSNMIDDAFGIWDYCGTDISGNVIGNILVDSLVDEASFEFSLSASSVVSTQECNDTAPNDSLFVTVANVNGSWLITRMSEGVDTRDRELVIRNVMLTNLSQANSAGTASFIPDGGVLTSIPTRDALGAVSNGYTFSWDTVADASSYAFVIFNAQEEWRGRAYILPSTLTELSLPLDEDLATGSEVVPLGVSKQHDLFGFSERNPDGNRPSMLFLRDGEEFHWTVMAMGSKTVGDFENDRVQNPFDDIIASSSLSRYKNPGEIRELLVDLTDTSNNTLVFNEIFDGYDAGAAGSVTITVTSPNFGTGALLNDGPIPTDGACCGAGINVSGSVYNYYPLIFDSTTGIATAVIELGNGFNQIDIFDGVGEFKYFTVQTTGGILPPIEITNVSVTLSGPNGAITNQNYTPDIWGYIDTSAEGGATSVTLTGSVSDSSISQLNFNVGSEVGAYTYFNVQVSGGSFSATFDLYTGNNWIGIDSYSCADQLDPSTCNSAYANVGIFSSAGSSYVAPIREVTVSEAILVDDWGAGANWDASADADNIVEIAGVLAFPNGTINYDLGSDGGYENGIITPNPDGSFVLQVSLFNGNNWFNINDAQGNYYSVSIFTTAGQLVVKPVINSINSVSYDDSGFFQTDQCSVTIEGVSLADSEVNVYWNGFDSTGLSNFENFMLIAGADDGTGLGSFSVTLPVMGGSNSYNSVSINDANYVGIYLEIQTSDVNCSYVAPVLDVTSISSGGTSSPLISDGFEVLGVDDGNNNVIDYNAGSNATVSLSGASGSAGRSITAEVLACNGKESYSALASNTANVNGDYDWNISGIAVYQDYNSLNISDGVNYRYLNVISTNGITPLAALTATATASNASGPVSLVDQSTGGSCGYVSYDGSSATSVTISGTSSGPDGMGSYWDSSGSMQTFEIVGGAYSFEAGLFDGYNYFSINDANFNYTNVDIFTTNGTFRPQLVTITSPLHSEVIDTASGPVAVTVTGIIDVSVDGFNPERISAFVYIEDVATDVSYSSDQFEVDSYGYMPITYDTLTGDFSFVITVSSDQPVNISVDAYNSTTGESHGQSIVINNVFGYGDYSYKPGAKATAKQTKSTHNERINYERAGRAFMRSRMSRP